MATFTGPILKFSVSTFTFIDMQYAQSQWHTPIVGIKNLVNGVCYPKMSLSIHGHDRNRFSRFHYGAVLSSGKIQNLQKLYFYGRSSASTHILSAGRNYELNYNDDSRTEPFWLNIIHEAIWTSRSLLLFLVEQPSQLKYIEWPRFQSTMKTATLTLVLVTLLIVALSSVDSALSYLLALLLRRKA